MDLFAEIQQNFPSSEFYEFGDHKIFFTITPQDLTNVQEPLFFPYPKGVIRLKGKDAAIFLQGLTTNKVQQMLHNQILRNLFLNTNGRIAFDCFVEHSADEYVIYCEPGQEQLLIDLLAYYQVVEEVTIEPGEPTYVWFCFYDQLNKDVLANASYQDPVHKVAFFAGWSLAKLNEFFPQARLIGIEAFDQLRPYFGWARSGIDFHDQHYPLEAGLNYTVDYKKGCFVGQEPVARMFHKGKATKLLCKMCAENRIALDKIFADQQAVGLVTSSSRVAVNGRYWALGYVKSRLLENPLDARSLSVCSRPVLAKALEGVLV